MLGGWRVKPGATRSGVAKPRRRLWEEPVHGTGAGDADDEDSNDPGASLAGWTWTP